MGGAASRAQGSECQENGEGAAHAPSLKLAPAQARQPTPAIRPTVSHVSPDQFLRTPRDAAVVLVLRCLRTVSLLLVLLGVSWIAVSHATTEGLTTAFQTPAGFVQALTTPLAGVALAVAVRALVAGLAWITATPLVLQEVPPLVATGGQSGWRDLTDRWRQISAAAAVRGTWAVRAAAISKAGTAGRALRMTDLVLKVLCAVAAVAMVGTLLVTNW